MWRSWAWTGICAGHKDVFERIAWDERFDDVGHEADAFLMAADTLTDGTLRCGTSIHLWHSDLPATPWRVDGAEERAFLLDRYARAHAANDEVIMQVLVDGKVWTHKTRREY